MADRHTIPAGEDSPNDVRVQVDTDPADTALRIVRAELERLSGAAPRHGDAA